MHYEPADDDYEESLEQVNRVLLYAKDLLIEGGEATTDAEADECFGEMVDVIDAVQSYDAWRALGLDEEYAAEVMELPVDVVRTMMVAGAERAGRADHV